MKGFVKDSKILDQRAINMGLDETILMENAGQNLAKKIKKALKNKKAKILFVLGSGNNGADGLVSARAFENAYLYEVNKKSKESLLFEKQKQIALNLGLKFLEKEPDFDSFDCIVDCIFGSGLNKDLDDDLTLLINKLNKSKAFKIACDIPSGLGFNICFKADLTICMGALKEILLQDYAKDFVGKIKIVSLGMYDEAFLPQNLAEGFLLTKKDLNLVKRTKNSNKSTYGHVFICGSKSAGTLSALGALNFGAGLVSLVNKTSFSPLIMCKDKINNDASAIAIGMGLKDLSILDDDILDDKPLVLDANCFNSDKILKFLNKDNVILTPHPKEFSKLLKIALNLDIDTNLIQKNRFEYVKKFSQRFNCVLVLKGANTIISQNNQIFVINCGTHALAKGGSGDVLSGMIAALLANHFSPLKAACNACLAHALVAKKYKFNHFSFDALKLIKGLKCL